MLMGNEQNQRGVLVHWNYSVEEWKSFTRWTKLSRGRLHYFFYYWFGKKHPVIPEITITNQKIWRGDTGESFSDVNRHIKRINIRDTGKLNILEITYMVYKNGLSASVEIQLPIPKGKLKEAISIQERLMVKADDNNDLKNTSSM